MDGTYFSSWATHCYMSQDERPNSYSECYDDGENIDLLKFLQMLEKQSDLDRAERNVLLSGLEGCDDDELTATTRTTTRTRTRRSKALTPCYFDDEGNVAHLKPREAVWFFLCVKLTLLEDKKFNIKFCRRFRMPHAQHVDLLDQVKIDPRFSRWMSCDCAGVLSSPIELMVLGALRHLGRGLAFDDLEEFTAINEETHRQFFHKFIDFGSTVLYNKYVRMPTAAAECHDHRHEFDMGGLTGAGFSTDATNAIMWRCSHHLKQANMGFKQSHPARSYNMCVNHRRQMLHSTAGHPSRWNDKTLACYDKFLSLVHQGKILSDVQFDLLSWTRGVGSPIKETKCSGAWGMCDNGYHLLEDVCIYNNGVLEVSTSRSTTSSSNSSNNNTTIIST